MPEPTKKRSPKTERKSARKATATRTKRVEITHDHIAERAYFLSLERGGDPFANWLQAERELATA